MVHVISFYILYPFSGSALPGPGADSPFREVEGNVKPCVTVTPPEKAQPVLLRKVPKDRRVASSCPLGLAVLGRGTGERGWAYLGSVPGEGLFPRLSQTRPLHLWA